MARTSNTWRKSYFEVDSFITGYHVYKDQWLPEHGEMLTVENEPDNAYDGFSIAVKKDKNVVGHLPRDEKHILFLFLQEDITARCVATVTGNPVNLGDKLGQKVPCRLRMSGRKEYVEVLKRITRQ